MIEELKKIGINTKEMENKTHFIFPNNNFICISDNSLIFKGRNCDFFRSFPINYVNKCYIRYNINIKKKELIIRIGNQSSTYIFEYNLNIDKNDFEQFDLEMLFVSFEQSLKKRLSEYTHININNQYINIENT